MNFKLDKEFVLLDYTLSHSQLVFRAIKNDASEKNYDIIFFDVEKIDILISYKGISIDWNPQKNNINFYIEDSEGKKGLISAAFFNVLENTFDFLQSSIFKELNENCKLIFNSNNSL